MIEADGLTERYGDRTAVSRLNFVPQSGVATGFFGLSEAAKSTMMPAQSPETP
jgi:ABC-2 type transport system ATP-binding protein